MKAVMLSIHPKWCCKILNGEKTVEIRKTKPKISVPFKCYIYCTKSSKKYKMNGKVIGEFVCDSISKYDIDGLKWWDMLDDVLRLACLEMEELQKYVGNDEFYGWHISNFKIYDKPKELSVFNLNRSPQSWCYCEENK